MCSGIFVVDNIGVTHYTSTMKTFLLALALIAMPVAAAEQAEAPVPRAVDPVKAFEPEEGVPADDTHIKMMSIAASIAFLAYITKQFAEDENKPKPISR